MAQDGNRQRTWVSEVLGLDLAGAGAPADTPADLLAIWQDAKEAVDAQLSALQRTMEADDDPDFTDLAQTSLFTLGTRENVALIASLREFGAASAEARAERARQVRRAVESYAALLAGSDVPNLLDENPFGVSVTMEATLNGALGRIAALAH